MSSSTCYCETGVSILRAKLVRLYRLEVMLDWCIYLYLFGLSRFGKKLSDFLESSVRRISCIFFLFISLYFEEFLSDFSIVPNSVFGWWDNLLLILMLGNNFDGPGKLAHTILFSRLFVEFLIFFTSGLFNFLSE